MGRILLSFRSSKKVWITRKKYTTLSLQNLTQQPFEYNNNTVIANVNVSRSDMHYCQIQLFWTVFMITIACYENDYTSIKTLQHPPIFHGTRSFGLILDT